MEHLVIFMNYDGKELYKVMVKDGATAEYKGQIPVKPGEDFLGWNKELTNVKDDMIVIAVYGKNKTGNLNLAAISFVEEGQNLKVIDNVVISNEDLNKAKDNELEK